MTDEITKRRVTMRSVVAVGYDDDGKVLLQQHEAVDYVRPDFLDAYVTDAQQRWQQVLVSDEPDAGEGGYDGPTFIPEHLAHPEAGMYFPATSGSKAEADLIASGNVAAIATEGSDTPVHISTVVSED